MVCGFNRQQHWYCRVDASHPDPPPPALPNMQSMLFHSRTWRHESSQVDTGPEPLLRWQLAEGVGSYHTRPVVGGQQGVGTRQVEVPDRGWSSWGCSWGWQMRTLHSTR